MHQNGIRKFFSKRQEATSKQKRGGENSLSNTMEKTHYQNRCVTNKLGCNDSVGLWHCGSEASAGLLSATCCHSLGPLHGAVFWTFPRPILGTTPIFAATGSFCNMFQAQNSMRIGKYFQIVANFHDVCTATCKFQRKFVKFHGREQIHVFKNSSIVDQIFQKSKFSQVHTIS